MKPESLDINEPFTLTATNIYWAKDYPLWLIQIFNQPGDKSVYRPTEAPWNHLIVYSNGKETICNIGDTITLNNGVLAVEKK